MDFNLKKKMASTLPYGIIFYLLCGGLNAPMMSDIDSTAFEVVVGQADSQAPSSGVQSMYEKLLGKKNPNGNMPGKAHFSGPDIKESKEDPIAGLIRKVLQMPSKFGGGTNYGY